MDIPKIEDYALTAYARYALGNIQEKTARRIFNLDFSCDAEDYLKLIYEFIHSERDYRIAMESIHKMITACLIIGDIQNDLSKWGIPLKGFKCDMHFNIQHGEEYRDQQVRYIRSMGVLFQVYPNESVKIVVDEGRRNNDVGVDLLLDIREPYLPEHLMYKYHMLLGGGHLYQVRKIVFNPPPYDTLPLYVNVPFLREYARHMFKNPPPPPVTYTFRHHFNFYV